MRGTEGLQRGFQHAALDQIIALAGGKIRHAGFGGLRIGENARLVCAFVDRGAADFGVELTEHIQFVIDAMKPIAGELGLLQGTSADPGNE